MKQAIVTSLFFTVTIFAACNSSSSSDPNTDTTVSVSTQDTSKMMAAVKYTCEMHPEVISDAPGKCPKCEMDLIPLSDTSLNKMNMDTMNH